MTTDWSVHAQLEPLERIGWNSTYGYLLWRGGRGRQPLSKRFMKIQPLMWWNNGICNKRHMVWNIINKMDIICSGGYIRRSTVGENVTKLHVMPMMYPCRQSTNQSIIPRRNARVEKGKTTCTERWIRWISLDQYTTNYGIWNGLSDRAFNDIIVYAIKSDSFIRRIINRILCNVKNIITRCALKRFELF